MKNLVDKFLTEDDKARIIDTVKKTEKNTAGEIVPMVVSSSDDYPMSGVIGAFALSIPLSLIGAYFAGPLFGMAMRDLWVFLGIETVLFLAWYQVFLYALWLRRIFTSRAEMEEEVRKAALAGFYQNGLYRTRGETGVLIYVSIFERMVWVLGDRGINEKVGQEEWKGLVSIITGGIKNKKQGDAICRAVERAGEILHEHFPIRPGDTDELPNLIRGK